MLSGEIVERNFCSHCCSAREPSLEKPDRTGAASCCAKSVQATEIRTANMTKLRRIIPEPHQPTPAELQKLYAPREQIRSCCPAKLSLRGAHRAFCASRPGRATRNLLFPGCVCGRRALPTCVPPRHSRPRYKR